MPSLRPSVATAVVTNVEFGAPTPNASPPISNACDDCDASFDSQQRLAVHILSAHHVVDPTEGALVAQSMHEQLTEALKEEQEVEECDAELEIDEMEGETNEELDASTAPSTDRRFACDECERSFKAHYIKRNHMLKAHGVDIGLIKKPPGQSGTHKCTLCAQRRRTWSALRQHAQAAHQIDLGAKAMSMYYKAKSDDYYVDRPHRCDQCNRAYSNDARLSAHRRIVHQIVTPTVLRDAEHNATRRDSPFTKREQQASKPAHNAHDLRPPTIVYNEDYYAERPFKCEQCAKAFKLRDKLSSHGKLAHDLPLLGRRSATFDVDYYASRPFKCAKCPAASKTRFEFKKHMWALHKERLPPKQTSMPFACATCPLAFKTTSSLERHRSLAHGDASFRCSDYFDDCARTYMSKNQLTKHHERDHADAFEYNAVYYAARTHRCEHCPEAFTSVHAMIDHLYKVHNDDQRTILACASCPKTFKSAANLANHAQTQHKRYDFDCDAFDCGAAFTNQTHLTRHRASAHGLTTTTEVKGEEGGEPKLEVTDEAMEEPRNGILLGMMMEEIVKVEEKPEIVASPKAIQCKFCAQKLRNRYFYNKHVAAEHPKTEEKLV